MQVLADDDLKVVTGGSVWTGIAISAIVVFLSGVLEGFTNPGRCNN
ncbi:MAG: hypothetical protein PUC82_03580 [bacterium]|nr:hypothetical protein [bacterium]